jgi:hypothetical protein
MSFRAVEFAVAATFVVQAALMAQAPNGGGGGANPVRRQSVFESLAQPPVPNDPLELVTGDAQPVQDAEQRAAAVHLLTSAHDLSNVRAHPYDLKTTFVSSGASEGSWSLEDTSPSHDVYRWSAQGPSFSTINLRSNQLVYSNQPSGVIPLRLAQARTAIFFMYPQPGPRASLRTATGSLNGAEVTCILVANMAPTKPTAGPRRWEESEYCVDPKSGLLMSYSPVPGMYVAYNYANALHFHDKSIPGKFTITQAGQTAIEATTESVTDPGKLDPALFQPGGLEKIGAGMLMTPPWRVRTRANSGGTTSNNTLQVVVLDGMVDPQGQMTDLRVLASSNAALNQAAQEEAARWKNWQSQDDAQPGAAPQSHEVFFTVEFAPAQQ